MSIPILSFITFVFCFCFTANLHAELRFSVRPFGDEFKATDIRKQKGDPLEDSVTAKNFAEVTVAQGSGLMGFDAIRIIPGGKSYAVFRKSWKNAHKKQNLMVHITLAKSEIEGLIDALNRDKISQIKGSYSAGVYDGTQGFIELKTTQGRRYAWLDNYFEPLTYTFAYCNKIIWPKIKGARIVKKGIDTQAEYHRIFKKSVKEDGKNKIE